MVQSNEPINENPLLSLESNEMYNLVQNPEGQKFAESPYVSVLLGTHMQDEEYLARLDFGYYFRIVAEFIRTTSCDLTEEWKTISRYLTMNGITYHLSYSGKVSTLSKPEELFDLNCADPSNSFYYQPMTEKEIVINEISLTRLSPQGNQIVLVSEKSTNVFSSHVHDTPSIQWKGECDHWTMMHGNFIVTDTNTQREYELRMQHDKFVSLVPLLRVQGQSRQCCTIL